MMTILQVLAGFLAGLFVLGMSFYIMGYGWALGQYDALSKSARRHQTTAKETSNGDTKTK